MKILLNCDGLAPEEHASVAASIRRVNPEATVHEIDDQRSRRFDPVTVGAVASAVSAVCAAVVATLQAIQMRRDAQRTSRKETEETLVQVEITLNQRIDLLVRQELVTELQKLPEPIRIYLPDGNTFYEVSAAPSKELVVINGRPASGRPELIAEGDARK